MLVPGGFYFYFLFDSLSLPIYLGLLIRPYFQGVVIIIIIIIMIISDLFN